MKQSLPFNLKFYLLFNAGRGLSSASSSYSKNTMYSVVTILVTISLKSFELCSQEKSLNDQPKKKEDYSNQLDFN